jgi:hypothetical protein
LAISPSHVTRNEIILKKLNDFGKYMTTQNIRTPHGVVNKISESIKSAFMMSWTAGN